MSADAPARARVDRVHFRIVGHPEPAGSKRAFPVVRKSGVGVAVTDDNPKARGWKNAVAYEAAHAMMRVAGPARGADFDPAPELFDGPLGLSVVFKLARPKFHMGTGRNAGHVRASAPNWPTVKPDCTKLLRAVEDALTGVVWRDDAQVVEQSVAKQYGEPEGASVVVWKL